MIADGIHCIPIPTPFAVGRVNTYLIEDDPLTLVDSGPNSGKALDELERALRDRGHGIEDLGLIVVSHQHIDHEGLVDILARRSGAEVAALDPLADWLASYREQMHADDEFAEGLMRRHGIAEDVGHALRAVSAAFRGWGAPATVTRRLRDGDEIALRDRALRVHHRPGHSPTDTVFHDADRRLLIGADHLIKHISSNPLITRGHSRALMTYLGSLRRTRAMDVDLVLTGHGEPVADHRALIDERFDMHDKRAAKIASRIAANGPLTAHEIATSLWGNVALTQAYLTFSEVLGHVDLLLDRGEVVEDEGDDGVVRFRAA
ncbi:MAG TPA: MBL fold metallo-hydrolase [Solirubrobacteraceae bacterium]|nr:MBL fold metallo-hydrolase [Solirubrobacteraceae bacterium]